MIEGITNKILAYLRSQNQLSDNPTEVSVYKYGIEITLSSLLNFILIVSIGIITGYFFESLLFLLCFVPLRQYTGGYHANTYFKCNLYFCVCFAILLAIYTLTKASCSALCVTGINLFSVFSIGYFCPIENKNKKVADKDKKKFKIIAVIISSVVSIVSIILTIFNVEYGILISYTVLLVVVLIYIAVLRERRK